MLGRAVWQHLRHGHEIGAVALHEGSPAFAFYRDALGLEIGPPEDVPAQGVRVHFVEAGPASLELLEAALQDYTGTLLLVSHDRAFLDNVVTQTVAALYTQAALAELTVYPTSTALGDVPATGFADEVGLPGLFIIGFVLVVIILLSRRLRSTPEAR